ncbi:MAG: hypothetical protein IPM47_21060 [Sphingobacteriales bacterium]|nr:MAG: hypothetical protein IPM47_21060 [Sphingobacteriales bacterium]
MKTSILYLSVLCCLFIFCASNVFAQAKKQTELGPNKECGSCGEGCISCTVCDDKEMKTNCKEYICDTAGNCDELPKSKSKFYDFNNTEMIQSNTEQINTTKTSPVNINYVSKNAISKKTLNKSNTTVNVIQKGALKEGLNIIAVDKSKTLEIVQQSGQIVSMFTVNNQIKSNDLIADINTAKAQSMKTAGGKGLSFSCGLFACGCENKADCKDMLETVCGGTVWCDLEIEKCFCLRF